MRRSSYHDETHNGDVQEIEFDRHPPNPDDPNGLEHSQHSYYDPSPYHYLPPSQQPMQPVIDHHIHQHSYYQHQNVQMDSHQHAYHQRAMIADPMWPPPATAANDVYLSVDPTAADYHLQHPGVAVTLEDIMVSPQAPPVAVEHQTPHGSRGSTQRPSQATLHRISSRSKKNTSRRSIVSSTKKRTAASDGEGISGESTYVMRLHEMLEDAEQERQTHIVSWQPHGRAFRIHDETLFVKTTLPRYFNARIASFRRWLRAWGFIRITEGKDRFSWYHRYFVRGVTSLCKDMTRQQMAHAMVNWPPTGQVPDFYSAASGNVLSEQQQQQQRQSTTQKQSQGNTAASTMPNQRILSQTCANPKRLRGTILEDLRQMLDDAANEGNTQIVSWMPHGRAFKIHNKTLFQALMPRYFRTNKLAHLSDTLRIWGFRRLKKSGRDRSCFYHKFFVKDKPQLTRHLTRLQMKACMDDWPPREGEPDLYGLHEEDERKAQQNDTPGIPHEKSDADGDLGFSQSAILGSVSLGQGASSDNIAATFPPGQDMDNTIPQLSYQPFKTEVPDTNRGDGTYVMRLHEMLEDAEKEGHQHIVSWQPHGRAFRIHKEKEFVEHIMPRYFKAKMGSFLRWCRAWGFSRVCEGKDRGSWYHRYFIRGVTSLSRNMSRQQMLKAMEDWLPPGHVPNFYSSGMGEILSERRQEPLEPPRNVTCKNPKRLRGTVPEDLRQMLEEAELEGNSHIVAWLPHGRAFKIFDKRRFISTILPRYFKASKYTYFSDALRMWGWQRLKQGADRSAYYHNLFVKDQPQLTRHLTRIQMKASMTPWPPAEGERDLYAAHIPEKSDAREEPTSATGDTNAQAEPVPIGFHSPDGKPIIDVAVEPSNNIPGVVYNPSDHKAWNSTTV